MDDSISLSGKTVDAINTLDIGDFCSVELPERMAGVVLILRRLEDRAEWFPKGKWATIQEIERQLEKCADAEAARVQSTSTLDSKSK